MITYTCIYISIINVYCFHDRSLDIYRSMDRIHRSLELEHARDIGILEYWNILLSLWGVLWSRRVHFTPKLAFLARLITHRYPSLKLIIRGHESLIIVFGQLCWPHTCPSYPVYVPFDEYIHHNGGSLLYMGAELIEHTAFYILHTFECTVHAC